MKFSVVIPTYERDEMLAKCLNQLAPGAQSLPFGEYEVIVSDDSERNEAMIIMTQKFPWARWVKGPRTGPAANRNNGAHVAQGSWLVFTDDDCVPDSNWLKSYTHAISANPDCKAFEGAILPDDWSKLKKDMAECPVNNHGGCFWSANIMVEKALFDKIGGFDERFILAAQEDQDLKIMISAYSSIAFVGEAIVIHPVRIVPVYNRILNIKPRAYNWLIFLRKHYDIKGRVLAINESLCLHARLAVKSILKGHIKRTIFHFISCLFVLFYKSRLIKEVIN